MSKKYFCLLFLLLCTGFAFSQTLYEFHYHYPLSDGGKEEYKAFVLRNDDGTGIIRVAFFDAESKTRNIVEMETAEHFLDDENGAVDSTELIVLGSEPVHIVGDVPYLSDHFIFKLGDQGYFEPTEVISFLSDSTDYTGSFDEVRLLNQEDLTEDLVLQYFTVDDDFYKNLFETTVRSLDPQEKMIRLHLILIANTNDKTIGKTTVTDKESILSTFKDVTEFLGIQFVPTVISGSDFSKANVDKAVSDLRPSANDIVVFYYSGHGFSDKNDPSTFPYMDLRDKSFQTYGGPYAMNVEAVFQKIVSKGARLNLVLSDCCNNDPTQTASITSDDPNTRVSSIGWNKNKCIALFMNPQKTSMLMTAAQKGELSAGNISDGGFFTYNFREALEKHLSNINYFKETSWNSIVTTAKVQTAAKVNEKRCRQPDNSISKCVQHPVYRSL